MSEEKSTTHNVIVRLLSESAITNASAVFSLAKTIDKEALEDQDIIILGYSFDDSELFDLSKKVDHKPSALAEKFKEAALRSPGALGDLYARYGWKGLYLCGAFAILLTIIAVKWTIRLLTGTFF